MKKLLAILVFTGSLVSSSWAQIPATPVVPAAAAPTPPPAVPAPPAAIIKITPQAKDSPPPDVVANGFKAYLTGGYGEAINVWVRGSALELDTAARTALNNSLSQVDDNAGRFVGPELIRIVNLSLSSELVYTYAKYQKGAIYMAFACYKSADKWLITSIVVNADPSKVLPTNVLGGL